MNQLQKIFNYQEQQVRTVIQNDEPWFVAKDVCEILELTNPSMVVNRLEDDERSKFNLGRQGETNIVNESGLYELIFASRKPEAKVFKKWVKQEVLPSIRKTGSYSTDNIVPLNDKQSLIALMKLSAITAEETEELKLVTSEHSNKLQELEKKVDEQITLSSGEQRRFQIGVSDRVYSFTSDKKEASRLFKELYKEIKNRFGVPSYRDLRRDEFQSALRYVEAWVPRKVS